MFRADTRTVAAALGVFGLACVLFQPHQQRQMFVMVPMPQEQQYMPAYAEVLPPQYVASRAGMPEMNVHTGPGKGFGGGEATRDPAATVIDPNDPKGKQQAIHKAESFADYLARRSGAPAAPAPAAAAAPAASNGYTPPAIEVHTGAGKGFGGGEATRDPKPTEIDPNDPKGKQQAIHKAESFAEYLARRGR